MKDPASDFRQLLAFYKQQLHGDIMGYWMKHVDWDHGGVLNCISNRGDKRLSDHKFVWSQGRFAWQCARLFETSAGDVPEETRRKYLEASRGAARFLMSHARLSSGNCAFILSRDGRPVLLDDAGRERPARPGETPDFSIHADNFASYGVGEYARVSGDREAWEWTKDLFASVLRRHADGSARYDFPYPPPPGSRIHGTPMGLLEYCGELGRAAGRFGDAAFAEELARAARGFAAEIMDKFVQPDGLILEILDGNWQPTDTLLGRYVNPGHTLEDMWFVIHHALRVGDRRLVERAAEVARATCRAAWDAEFGGIPQFMDKSGGQPKGLVPPELEKSVMVGKVRTLWDKKLWWPHSEALYALLLIHEQTGQGWALDEYRRYHEYTFRTFPNPDRSVGEWIQIRDRRGAPEEAVVALPVKDPMHIARAYILIIECLKRLLGRGA